MYMFVTIDYMIFSLYNILGGPIICVVMKDR